jgi:hypothetical protein
MLSGPSNPYPSRDEKTDNCAAAEATEAILTPINENMSPTYSAPIPAGQEARNEFDTINLIYDLNEIKVAKANHLRFSAPRSAPPPPYRAIVLKSKSAMRFLDILHQAVDESKNIEMADVNGLKEGWYTTIQWSLRKMGKAGLASLRMLTLTTGPELEAPECVAFERSECHEVCFYEGIQQRAKVKPLTYNKLVHCVPPN